MFAYVKVKGLGMSLNRLLLPGRQKSKWVIIRFCSKYYDSQDEMWKVYASPRDPETYSNLKAHLPSTVAFQQKAAVDGALKTLVGSSFSTLLSPSTESLSAISRAAWLCPRPPWSSLPLQAPPESPVPHFYLYSPKTPSQNAVVCLTVLSVVF